MFFLSVCAGFDATKWPPEREPFYTVFWGRFAACVEFSGRYTILGVFSGYLVCKSPVVSVCSHVSRAAKHKRSHVIAEGPTFCWIFLLARLQ